MIRRFRATLAIAAVLLLTACVTLPPDVREALSPPDDDRPNNYELVE